MGIYSPFPENKKPLAAEVTTSALGRKRPVTYQHAAAFNHRVLFATISIFLQISRSCLT